MRAIECYPGRAFAATADPELFFLGDSAREAYDAIVEVIRDGRGLVALNGAPGVGKTMLLGKVAHDLAGECRAVVLAGRFASFEDLARQLCLQLGAGGGDRESAADLVARLGRHLLDTYVDGASAAVLIDDAHLIDDEVLADLHHLADLGALLPIVLAGTPALETKLRRRPLATLEQRITARVALEGLHPDELFGYLSARFREVPQRPSDLFDTRDLERAFSVARGLPRTLNTICDNALILAFARGRLPATEKDVSEAIRAVLGKEPLAVPRRVHARKLLGPALAAPGWLYTRRFFGPALTACLTFGAGLALLGAHVGDTIALAAAGHGRAIAAAAPLPAVTAAPVASPAAPTPALTARGPVPPVAAPSNPASLSTAARDAADAVVRPGSRVPTLYPLGFGPHCGDAYLDDGEECDDGNAVDGDECLSNCREPVCGDGVVHTGVEQCDDGNARNDDACLFGCILPGR